MKRTILLFILSVCISLPMIAQDKVLDALSDEVKRNMDALKSSEVAPYFISYRVNDIQSITIKASFGQLVSNEVKRASKMAVSVRVGNSTIDNSHQIKGEDYGWFDWDQGVDVPCDGSVDGIKQLAWKETESKYRKACDLYSKVVANMAVKVEDEDKSDDFSKETPVLFYEAPLADSYRQIDNKLWEEKLKKYSAIFLENKDLRQGEALLMVNIERKYFVSTEGSKIAENRITCRLMLNGETIAEDGMVLPLYESFFGFETKDLPSDEEIIASAKNMVKLFGELKNAPIVDSYTGPALLAPASAGVFFHEIFGHRIEAQRMKNEDDAQTFKKKVEEKVIQEDLSIIFDPTITKLGKYMLNGSYKYDDQGVKSEKVTIIEKGILKDFLVSRTPIKGFPKSNGHGRAQAGMQAVSRQSNLIVTTAKPYTSKQMRQLLIDEAKKQNKEYGYLFVSTVGGFTTTGRYMPNAFNVTPTVVYRVYVDGRPDQLVRGVDLIGTPLSIFSNIEAAGDTPGVFTGTCGAESGGVPTSTICPEIFVKQIETQRKSKEQNKPAILSRP
ncbi:MAG: metallopeptidase TldD-related protein [Bacteroidota bacterium]